MSGYCMRCGRSKMLEEEAVYHVVCPHCGTHEDDTIKPILAADLRKLVENWREENPDLLLDDFTLDYCADRLEELYDGGE